MLLAAGTRLGVYELTGLLGTGGMGEVYRAIDTKLGREVAIKTLPNAFAQDRDRLARFEREAKLLAALNHAHIAVIYGLGEHEGTQFLAMELVEGQTIEELLKRGALPMEDALRLALEIAAALEAAHEKGVVHRDLKPANIMMTREGQVKVLDFGLAKAFAGDPNAASPVHSPTLSIAMTQQGLVLGTAGYMSPEQASGQATDQRADIWAIGVVLYEMLTGVPPFAGESVPHILADVLRAEPDWSRLPKNIHPRLKRLLERCLEKKVRDRYHSMADVRLDIEDVLSDPEGATRQDARRGAPGRSSATAVAAAVVLTAAGAALLGWIVRPAPEPARVSRFSYSVPENQTLRSPGRPIVALSPDGRHFVYNTGDGLYLRSMDELEARRLPGTEEILANPFFSSDGQSVAYYAAGQLKRVALSGGAPVVIAEGLDNLFGASSGSDGSIFFAQTEGIFRISADGGRPELVIPAKEGELFYGPRLLPDGDSVLFTVTTTSNWTDAQIVAQSLSRGERTGLIPGGDAHYVPTGHVIYALGDALFAVAFDADTLTVSGGSVPLVQGVRRAVAGLTAAANYGVADDGTLVYLTATLAEGQDTLLWVDRGGNEESLGFDACICASPAISPDGTRVAVQIAIPNEPNTNIWVLSLAQRTRTRVSFEPRVQAHPLWSPDSRRIAYTSDGGGILVRNADGTGAFGWLLEGTQAVDTSAWVGDELVFGQTGPTGWDIAAISPASDRERRSVLATQFDERHPALSPDARWLAYQSDESGQWEIYVRPFPDVDAGKWQISSDGGGEPKWGRDGRTLFFRGPSSLMETAVSTTPSFAVEVPKVVLDLESYVLTTALNTYDVSPDGQRFLMLKRSAAGADAEAAPAIVVVTNWVEELKRRVPTE
jgi:serine/threonine-protein kinase